MKNEFLFVITGANRGIGKYLTNLEYFRGAVILQGKTDCDITKPEQVKQLFELLKNSGGEKKICLINCAGINYNSFAHKADLEQWSSVIDVNIKGTFNVINTVLPMMRLLNWGRIINLSSVVGQTGVMGTSCYSASKSALTGMIKSIAMENACNGITINNLNLGYFNIGMIEQVPVEIRDKIKQTIPCKQFGNPKNIVNAIKFLIDSDYVNGSSIDINGGLY